MFRRSNIDKQLIVPCWTGNLANADKWKIAFAILVIILLMRSKLFFHVDYDARVRFLIYSFLYLQNSFFDFQIFINILFETRIVNFTQFLSTSIHYLYDRKISEPYHIPIICSEFLKNFAIFETYSLSAKFETTKFNLKQLKYTGWR